MTKTEADNIVHDLIAKSLRKQVEIKNRSWWNQWPSEAVKAKIQVAMIHQAEMHESKIKGVPVQELSEQAQE